MRIVNEKQYAVFFANRRNCGNVAQSAEIIGRCQIDRRRLVFLYGGFDRAAFDFAGKIAFALLRIKPMNPDPKQGGGRKKSLVRIPSGKKQRLLSVLFCISDSKIHHRPDTKRRALAGIKGRFCSE